MGSRKNEVENKSNQEILSELKNPPSPINLHLYQPPRLLNIDIGNRTGTIFDITGQTVSSKGFNYQITTESYAPLINNQILADKNISWNLYGVTADWLEINQPELIENLKKQMEAGAKPPVGDTYLHIIFPFLSQDHKDMLLKISKTVYKERWGVEPETVWLPESAVDSQTLDSLAKNDFKGVHLREHQTYGSRGNIQAVSTNFGKILAISGHNYLSGLVGFDKPWADTFFDRWHQEANNLGFAPRISIDGETLGHWWKAQNGVYEFTSYLLKYLKEGNEGKNLNFNTGEIFDARLVENTSWSCMDTGLGRWKGDPNCYCGLPENGWQANQIRSSKRDLFEKLSESSYRIDNILDESQSDWREIYKEWFLSQRFSLAKGLPISADFLKDKALEKLFISAYIRDLGWTSCGWFFGDVNGFERQIPANSLRAIAEIMSWPDILPNS